MKRETVDAYERQAHVYAERRPPVYGERARALAARALPGRPVIDAGCGPGGYLVDLARAAAPDGAGSGSVIALDAAWAMLELAGAAAPGAPRLQADLEALPFQDRSLGGAWARASYLHVAAVRLPLALARLHWALDVGAPLELSVFAGEGEGPLTDDDIPGRSFTLWSRDRLADVVAGAGFEVEAAEVTVPGSTTGLSSLWIRARRARTLPDTVGPGMRVLCCGLNPSLVAADAGVAYAGRTNRFWPIAVTVGLASHTRDPLSALAQHGTGMTDLVKRATSSATALAPAEYREGAERVRRLVEWLLPGVVLFVGLSGWRAAVDSAAPLGVQPGGFGGRPAYVMPSTSGRNAHSSTSELADHMRRALALA